MADKISILINTKLNTDPEAIQKQLNTLSKKVKLSFVPRINFDTDSIAKFKADVDRLAKKVKLNLDVAIDKNIINQKIQDATKEVQDAVKNASKTINNANQAKIKIFDSEQLEKDGNEFFIGTNDIINRVKNKYSSLGDVNVNFNKIFKDGQEEVVGFTTEIKKLDGTIDKLKFDLAEISGTKGFVSEGKLLIDKNAGDNIQNALNKLQTYETKLASLQASFLSPTTGIKDTKNLDVLNVKYKEIYSNIEKLKASGVSLSNEQKRSLTQAIAGLESEIRKRKELEAIAENAIKKERELALYKQKMLGGNGLRGELDIFAEKQKGRFDPTALTKIKDEINALTKDTPNLQYRIKELGNQFSILKQEAGKSNSVLLEAITNAGKFLRFYLVGGVLVGFVNIFKGAIGTIYELDTAITDLKKVSDEIGNSVGVKEFLTDVNKLAIEVGHSTKAAVESITEFKKLGYDLAEAQKLTEQALVYSNISDQNIQDATKSIISTLKGFSLGVEDVNHVMDAYNEVDLLLAS